MQVADAVIVDALRSTREAVSMADPCQIITKFDRLVASSRRKADQLFRERDQMIAHVHAHPHVQDSG